MIGLKKIRKMKNLNQQKVAMDLNISREALSFYENGKREPSLTMLVNMSKYFNVSIDYLITGEEFHKKWVCLFYKYDRLIYILSINPLFLQILTLQKSVN